MARSTETTVSYRDTDQVKHAMTEEVFDLYVNRRVASWLVQALVHTPITANQVTLMGAALAAASGYLVAVGTAYSLGWAAVCLMTAMVFDCTDGQLARMRGGGSKLGRALDGASDYTNAVALHLGMWSYLASTGVLFRERLVDGWGLFAWVLLAGVSMALHAGLFDFRKQWFLIHTTRDKAELDDPAELRRAIAQSSSTFKRAALWTYVTYATVQIKLTGGCDSRYIEDPELRRAFTQRARPYLRALNMLGPTHHNVLLLLAMVAAPFFAQSFWWYILTVTVPLNLVYAVMVFWGRRLDAAFKDAALEGSAASA